MSRVSRRIAGRGALVLCLGLALGVASVARGQYMYLDANGNGVHDAGDVLSGSGSTTFDIWLDSAHNRDGSSAVCVTGDGGLTVNSYEFILHAVGGAVTWGAFTNNQPSMTSVRFQRPSIAPLADYYHDGYGGSTQMAPGLYRLGTLTITTTAGCPSVEIVAEHPFDGAALTSFGTQCTEDDEFSQTCTLGTQWQDVDGLGPAPTGGVPPAIAAPASASGDEGTPITLTATGTDPDVGQTLTITARGAPASLAFSSTPGPSPVTATISGTLGFGDAGIDSIVWTVSDGPCGYQTSATTVLTVNNVDRPPVVTAPATVAGMTSTPLNVAVVAADPDGDAIASLTATPLPSGATFSTGPGNTAGTLSWTPNQTGSYPVTFTAANALSGSTGTLITVANAPPLVAAPAYVSAVAGAPLRVDVTASDPDGDPVASLTANLSSLPAGNDAVFRTNNMARTSGTLTWTPRATDLGGSYPVEFIASNATADTAVTILSVTDAQGPSTARVSVASDGTQAAASSEGGVLSSNGRFVAFYSDASNLVPGDTNGVTDVFVHDLAMGTTERVSVGSGGTQANGSSNLASISGDGRYVTFVSLATNLVPGDTNGVQDLFLHDRQTGDTERISVDSAGNQGDATSYDGDISDDGRYVAFFSDATNLVPDDTNGTTDVFVRDRTLGTTSLVSVSTTGTVGNGRSAENSGVHISPDGRYVVFPSVATNLVPADNNNQNDVFLRDLVAGTTELVSVSSAGVQGDLLSAWGDVSSDGRYVVFSSEADNLVSNDTNATWDIFLRDRQAGTTERVSVSSSGAQANANSGYASVSSDGRFVAFHSYASNLVLGDTNGISDVFVRDRVAGLTERVSVDTRGYQAAGPNVEVGQTSLSADGQRVAYFFGGTNLVSGDTNGATDVFVRDLGVLGVSGWPNLVAYWRMNGTGGDPVTGNTLFPNGGVTFPAGRLGSAADVPNPGASTGYLQAPATASYSITPSGFTVECWVKVRTEPGYDPRIIRCVGPTEGPCGDGTTNVWELAVCHLSCAGGIVLFNLQAAGTCHVVYSTTSIDDSLYHHVAATYDGTELKIYIDGVLNNSSPAAGLTAPVAGGKIVIGNSTHYDNAFDGLIDELRVWNVARSGSDILASMNSELQTTTPTGNVPEPVHVRDALLQNVPNPFNPITRIRFLLGRTEHVRLNVFAADGRRVATLYDGVMAGGPHSILWSGLDQQGRPVASGVYFYRLDADRHIYSRRMVLLR